MKNLKRLMSVVLSVVMLLSFVVTTSAATFTDVAESDNAYEAVEILAALGILEGKEAGVFDPDANIKRSEFTAVICRAMNQSPVGVATFTDVAVDHWAYDYIAWAASQGIVNGRGDGTFDPDANVTYNEAIKMIVCAMGYEYYVENYLNGYPTGYARVAGSYKIDADVNNSNGNAAATRADVASLVYNAFDAPLMDYNYAIGSDMEYVIYNGSKNVDNEKRTLLSYYSDIYKFKATVDNTFKNNPALTDAKGNKMMNLTIQSTYGFDKEWLVDALGKNETVWVSGGALNNVIANNEAWANYQGYVVDAYITLNDSDKLEIVAMVPAATGEELVIDNAREMINVSNVADDATNAVTFEFEDENGKERTPSVSNTATIYVNNIAVGPIAAAGETYFEALATGAYPSVTLLDTDDDGTYDKIYMINYVYGIVEEVDADYEVIETTANDVFELSEDDTRDGFIYTIYKDGAEIGIEDLVPGDMLNIVIGDLGGDISVATFADIYVTNNTIESSVASVGGTGSLGDPYKYAIDDETYYTAATALCGVLDPGDTGVFYITIDGYIYDVDFTSTHSDNYGFILEMGKTTTAFGETWQIKLLDKTNAVKVLPVKDTMWVTDTVSTVYDRRQYKESDGTLATKMAAIAATLEEVVADGASRTAGLLEGNFGSRLVTFKETNGEITELVFATAYAPSTVRDFNVAGAYNTAQYYNEKTGRLGNMEMLDSSVLFFAPVAGIVKVDTFAADGVTPMDKWVLDADKVQVYNQSSLKDATSYNGLLYNVDANRAFGAALITSGMTFAGDANALAVITSKSTGLDAAGNTTTVLTLMQSGETKTIAVSDQYDSAFDVTTATAGDVIQYTVNAADEINKIEGVYDFSAKQLMKTGVLNDIEFKMGVVTENTGKVVALDQNGTANDAVLAWDLDDACTNVLYNTDRAGKANAFADKNGTAYIRAYKVDGSNVFTTDAYVAVVRMVDGVVVDVVAYQYAEETLIGSAATDTDLEFVALFTTAP